MKEITREHPTDDLCTTKRERNKPNQKYNQKQRGKQCC